MHKQPSEISERCESLAELEVLQNRIRVVNLSGASPCTAEPDEVVFRIDRKGALGNPYHMRTRSMPERMRVIALHRKDLPEILSQFPQAQAIIDEIALALSSGKKVALACHCAPLPCHGDNIREYLLDLVKEAN